MIRKLKVLGVTLVALAAFGAIASGAQAATAAFSSTAESTTLAGSASETSKFTTTAGTIECSEASFGGTATGKKLTKVPITSVSYGGCKFLGFINVAVEMRGCHYEFTAGTLTSSGHSTGTAAVVGSNCNTEPIRFAAGSLCTVTVGATGNSALTSINYENSGTKNIKVIPNVGNITYSQSGSFCSTATDATGVYEKGATVVKGNSEGATLRIVED